MMTGKPAARVDTMRCTSSPVIMPSPIRTSTTAQAGGSTNSSPAIIASPEANAATR